MVLQFLEVGCTLCQRFSLGLVQLTSDVDQPGRGREIKADKRSNVWLLNYDLKNEFIKKSRSLAEYDSGRRAQTLFSYTVDPLVAQKETCSRDTMSQEGLI